MDPKAKDLELKAINLDYLTLLQKHSKSKESLMTAVLQMYLETPALLNEIKNAYANRDRDLLNRAAHSLKSSSGNVGAHFVTPICATIEQMTVGQSPAADFTVIGQLIAQLEPAHAEAIREIQQLLKS